MSPESPAKKRSLRKKISIALGSVVLSLALAVGVALLVADAMDVELFVQTGHSMVPELPARTRFLRVPYRDAHPKPGDVVLVRDAFGGGQIVRRVIGVPGDRIAMDGFSPRVNGRSISARVTCPARLRAMVCMRERLGRSAWIAAWGERAVPRQSENEARIPAGFLYVLADHRDVARDSRDPLFSVLPSHAVLGHVVPIR